MRRLDFVMTFHSPFRVGAAYGRDGLDAVCDPNDPFPADHIKGLMLSSARRLHNLGVVTEDNMAAVFGSVASPSPWNWSGVEPGVSAAGTQLHWERIVRHRVEISNETHAALTDHVVFAEQIWAAHGMFTVRQVGRVPHPRTAEALLRLSARGVHAVGSMRRRGLGSVGVVPMSAAGTGPVSVADDLETLRGGAR